MGVTTTGESRERYAREVEARPSRFVNPSAYSAWAARADTFAAEHRGAPVARTPRRASLPQGTRVGTPEHELITAALASVKISPSNGIRPGDPLPEVVRATNWIYWHPVAEKVTGRAIERQTGDDLMAARIRATLRRWAIREK